MTTTRIDLTCPWCAAHHTATTGIDTTDTPSPGAISVCIVCARPSLFTDQLTLELPSVELMAEILADPVIAKAVAAIEYHRALDQLRRP